MLCFCETWLAPSQRAPQLRNDYINLRCDRTSPNNKGGVLISIKESFNPQDTVPFNAHGIEGIMTKLVLPNGTPLQLVLLYRSPSTPIDTFINVLNTIASQIQLQSIPTVIMGDMNDSLMDTGISRITTVLSVSGFTQLVTTPTTDKGTLIDHVYYNGPLDGDIV